MGASAPTLHRLSPELYDRMVDPRGREYGREQVLRPGDTLVAPVEGVPALAVGELFAILTR